MRLLTKADEDHCAGMTVGGATRLFRVVAGAVEPGAAFSPSCSVEMFWATRERRLDRLLRTLNQKGAPRLSKPTVKSVPRRCGQRSVHQPRCYRPPLSVTNRLKPVSSNLCLNAAKS